MDYLDPDIWMTLKQAAEEWGCHHNTVYNNWPRIPVDERLKHKGSLYIWRGTKFRPQKKAGRPPVNYYRKAKVRRVRDKYPNLPTNLSRLTPEKRELWLALIDAAYEEEP